MSTYEFSTTLGDALAEAWADRGLNVEQMRKHLHSYLIHAFTSELDRKIAERQIELFLDWVERETKNGA